MLQKIENYSVNKCVKDINGKIFKFISSSLTDSSALQALLKPRHTILIRFLLLDVKQLLVISVLLAFELIQPAQARDVTDARPSDYCVGFTNEACERIKAAVETKTKPGYCASRFLWPDNGLTREQNRVCDVFGNDPAREYCHDRPKPRGKRNFVWQKGGLFGYSKALSKSAQERGVAAEPLIVFRYQGRQDSMYEFFSISPELMLRCTEPCGFMELLDVTPQVIPVPEGSILAALVADARNGWLNSERVCTSDPNYKPSF